MSFDDKTFNINIYKDNKNLIDTSENKSEIYILLANEELNNKNKDLIQEISKLNQIISDLENDNERMEKSITYQRGLLHNFNYIKKYQQEIIKQYKKYTESNTNHSLTLMTESDKLIKILPASLLSSSILIVIMYMFISIDIISCLLLIITFISSKVFIERYYELDENMIIKFINNYEESEKYYLNNIYKNENNIKNIINKNDFIEDLIDNS
jgi:hypothetical protein